MREDFSFCTTGQADETRLPSNFLQILQVIKQRLGITPACLSNRPMTIYDVALHGRVQSRLVVLSCSGEDKGQQNESDLINL